MRTDEKPSAPRAVRLRAGKDLRTIRRRAGRGGTTHARADEKPWVEELGLADAIPTGMFSAAAPKPPPPPDPETTRQQRDSEAEARVRRTMRLAALNHQRLDVRHFSEAVFSVYRRLRGLSGSYVEGRAMNPEEIK